MIGAGFGPADKSKETSPNARPPAGLKKIDHFIFIMQENRSFDHYFGTYPGAEGIPPNVCLVDTKLGKCVKPYHEQKDVNLGGPHGWKAANTDIDNGKMDKFIETAYAA